MLGATDLRDLQTDASVAWKGRTLPLGDGPDSGGDLSCSGYSLIWTTPLGEPSVPPGAIPFSTVLDLRGTGAFRVVPIGHQIDLKASAAWTNPSFSGIALPSFYQVDDAGFIADWSVTNNPAIGGGAWSSAGMPSCDNGSGVAQSGSRQVSVDLIEAMPIYHMSERASKYAVLFLALSFLTYFLFETIARVRIHLVQYGLLGLSIVLFGLLLISFSEPLGFTPAYAVSSLLVLGQASLFTLSVTRVRRLAATFAGILAALFCFLYVVLSLELYALLVGSVSLFAALSVVMAVCRRIDWSSHRSAPETPRGSREAGRGILS
jgi:inner membrane protein